VVGLKEKDGIPKLPGQAEKAFSEIACLPIESTVNIDVQQAPERGEEPRAVVEPETQLPGGVVRSFLFE
jgi:hypothetical protein